jgi:hypothetical protein
LPHQTTDDLDLSLAELVIYDAIDASLFHLGEIKAIED